MKKTALATILALSSQLAVAQIASIGGVRRVETVLNNYKLANDEEVNFFANTTQIIPKECHEGKTKKSSIIKDGLEITCKPLPTKKLSKNEKSSILKSVIENRLKLPPPDSNDIISKGGPAPTGTLDQIDSVIMVADKLIALGEKVIELIKQGNPVVKNNPMVAVSVVPRTDLKDFVVHEMGGWSIPKAALYKASYSNGLGSTIAEFTYVVTFQYNGNLKGKGKYLNGIRIATKSINVSWGYDLDATSQLVSISNIGTEENVVAGAMMEVTYTVKNWMKNITIADGFFVDGTGKIYKIN